MLYELSWRSLCSSSRAFDELLVLKSAVFRDLINHIQYSTCISNLYRRTAHFKLKILSKYLVFAERWLKKDEVRTLEVDIQTGPKLEC
jgi:hypothetical protein